ncbi:hypothetical protein EXIGLDRAFT_718523 [Exidia glandulosa HHB12029]|uniref:FAD/NAD(P)-binding domain-containing protein n=1 Tax=Exidia glandulosa HHB12029 TaxID=1314781 RepID=A0A165NYU9_EXIGL|nr:hypothetical protein EXIGLDRAFT_718523 [Exidia glandulosa HHB12029]
MSLVPYATALALALPSYWLLKRALLNYMMRTYTGVPDLDALGKDVKDGKWKGKVAVIAGGSIAGLLTARVLSDHGFARILVVEPESWALSDEAADGVTRIGTRTITSSAGTYNSIAHKRSRVYQYTSIHVYQALLTMILRKLFGSGFDERAKGRGVLFARGDMNVRFSGWGLRIPYSEYPTSKGLSLPEILYTSRRTFEGVLRDCVRAFVSAGEKSPIEFLNGTVTDLNLSSNAKSIKSVNIREEGASATSETECDLFVDCTGATQAGLKMLSRASGASKLATLRENYDPQMNYVTIELPYPPNFEEDIAKIQIDSGISGKPPIDAKTAPWWLVFAPDPDVDYRAVFGGRRDNGIIFGGGGWASDMPVTLAQFREYAEGCKSDKPVPQWFFEIIDLCMPVADEATVFEAKINSCSRVCYERAADVLPSNFIALGDSTMRLNPRFGEGVTKAALGVTTLDGVLRSYGPSDNFAPTFFKRLAARTQGLWEGSKWTDYGRETTTPVPGETLNEGWHFRWYKSRLNRVLERDDAAGSALWHNLMYLVPAQYVMAPGIVAKVLWEAIFPTAPFVRRA